MRFSYGFTVLFKLRTDIEIDTLVLGNELSYLPVELELEMVVNTGHWTH